MTIQKQDKLLIRAIEFREALSILLKALDNFVEELENEEA